jgi:hypothetical protein
MQGFAGLRHTLTGIGSGREAYPYSLPAKPSSPPTPDRFGSLLPPMQAILSTRLYGPMEAGAYAQTTRAVDRPSHGGPGLRRHNPSHGCEGKRCMYTFACNLRLGLLARRVVHRAARGVSCSDRRTLRLIYRLGPIPFTLSIPRYHNDILHCNVHCNVQCPPGLAPPVQTLDSTPPPLLPAVAPRDPGHSGV